MKNCEKHIVSALLFKIFQTMVKAIDLDDKNTKATKKDRINEKRVHGIVRTFVVCERVTGVHLLLTNNTTICLHFNC